MWFCLIPRIGQWPLYWWRIEEHGDDEIEIWTWRVWKNDERSEVDLPFFWGGILIRVLLRGLGRRDVQLCLWYVGFKVQKWSKMQDMSCMTGRERCASCLAQAANRPGVPQCAWPHSFKAGWSAKTSPVVRSASILCKSLSRWSVFDENLKRWSSYPVQEVMQIVGSAHEASDTARKESCVDLACLVTSLTHGPWWNFFTL